MAFDGIGIYANSLLALADPGSPVIDEAGLLVDQVYRVPMLADTFFAPGTLYVDLYGYAAPAATAIVLAYMTLREVGKAGGVGAAAGKAKDTISDAIGKVTALFKR
jgi:hypothetical protein